MDGGWIKLARSLLDEAVFSDERLFRLLIWCKLRANHTAQRFHGELIGVGEFVTSMERAADALGCAKSTVWRGLEKLASPEFGFLRLRLVSNAKRKFTVVTVIDQTVCDTADDTPRNGSETVAERERNGSETGTKQIRELKNERMKEPPPPAPEQADAPGGWAEVVGELVRLGSGAADAVARTARQAGWSIEGATALIGQWREHHEAEGWGIGLLAHHLGLPPRSPAECLTPVRSAKPVDTRGAYETEQAQRLREADELARQKMAADREAADARLARLGPMIDDMTVEDRADLVRGCPSGVWLAQQVRSYGDGWRTAALVRDALLTAAERSQQETAA